MLKQFCALTLIAVLALGTQAEELPLLGSATSGLTLQQERELGKAWLRALRRQVVQYDNPLFQDYLDQKIRLLLNQSDLPYSEFDSTVIQSPVLNAFAVPGNIIGIQTGLILHIDNEPELLSVLAHEISHLQQRHFARLRENAQQQSRLQLTSMLAAILLLQTNVDLGSAALAAGSATAISNQLKYSRAMETEADRVGQQIMTSAGYRAGAVTSMLEKLQHSSLLSGENPPEYLLTHPITERRIADSRRYQGPIPVQSSGDSIEFQYHRLKIHQLHNAQQASLQQELQLLLQQEPSQEVRAAIHLLFAEQYASQQKFDRASTELERANRLFPYARIVRVVDASISWQSGQQRLALDKVRRLKQEYPSGIALGLMDVDMSLELGEQEQALQTLRILSRQSSENPMIWERLSILEAQGGNAWQSFRAQLEALWLNGQEEKAIRQIQFALRNKSWSAQERSRLNDRYHEMLSAIETARF